MGNSGTNSRRKISKVPQEYVDRDVSTRYNVGRRIGRGCYGVVYEAQEATGLGRECAIKKMLFAYRSATDAQRSYREVSYLLQFAGHSNIMTIYDLVPSKDDKHLYMVCELMDADLQKAIKSMKLEEYQQKFITYQMLRALKFIHSAGVIHRDMKPSNILINRNCSVKLADFGWSRALPASLGEGAMTEYASARWYRSPEMLLGGSRYTAGCDMWALACIAGEMCLREPLIQGACTQEMLDLMIDMFGKPTTFDIACMEAQYAQMMLEALPPEAPRRSIEVRMVGESREFVDFLQLSLQMNPEKRLTAQEALEHPHMANFHNPDDEPSFGRRVSLPVPDHQLLTSTRYRVQIYSDYLGLRHAKVELEDLRRKELRDEATLMV